jgi:hypothetical protein
MCTTRQLAHIQLLSATAQNYAHKQQLSARSDTQNYPHNLEFSARTITRNPARDQQLPDQRSVLRT